MDLNNQFTNSVTTFEDKTNQPIQGMTFSNSTKPPSFNDFNRFGNRSKNMFFVRHAAHPRNLRLITGVTGYQVCAMREDQYSYPETFQNIIRSATGVSLKSKSDEQAYISDPKYAIKFDSNPFNRELLKSYEDQIVPKQRKERMLPPITNFTNNIMLADDTKRWRLELNNFGKRLGIMTTDEIKSETNRITNLKTEQSNNFNLPNKLSSSFARGNLGSATSAENLFMKKPYYDESNNIRNNLPTSSKSGRFNETRRNAPASRKNNILTTSSNALSKLKTSSNKKDKFILCLEESDREVWLLQILCQILNTESMQEIQSWLVSAGPKEKEAMKELILKALDGLNQAGRIDNTNMNNSTANNTATGTGSNQNLASVVIDKTTQVDFDMINNSVNTFIENQKHFDQNISKTKPKRKKAKNTPKASEDIKDKEFELRFESKSLIDINSTSKTKHKNEFEKYGEKITKNMKTFEDFLSKSTFFPKLEMNISESIDADNKRKKKEQNSSELNTNTILPQQNIINKSILVKHANDEHNVERNNFIENSDLYERALIHESNPKSTQEILHHNDPIKIKVEIKPDMQILSLE